MSSYIGTARWIRALGREYDFVPLFVWQPTIHTTQKTLTPFDSKLLRELEVGDFGNQLVSLHRAVADAADETIGAELGNSFVKEFRRAPNSDKTTWRSLI